MKGIQEVYFSNSIDVFDRNVRITIRDEKSEYVAKVDYDQLIYALKNDLNLEVKE